MPRSTQQNQEIAKHKKIEGSYVALAEEMRRLMGVTGEGVYYTTREAAALTGVNPTTIGLMLRGHRPTESSVLKLAKALGGDVSYLLTLAGYPPQRFPKRLLDASAGLDGSDPQAGELLGLYHDMTPSDRHLLVSLARTVKAAREAVPLQEAGEAE